MVVLLPGCSVGEAVLTASPTLAAPTLKPSAQASPVLSAIPTPLPTASAAAAEPAAVPTQPGFMQAGAALLLKQAVLNLEDAGSFQITARMVNAYQIIDPKAAALRLVYGEFNTRYEVIRRPVLKVHTHSEYRYDPQGPFTSEESYTFEEGGRVVTSFLDASGTWHEQEIDPRFIEPVGGDIYQALVLYAGQAVFEPVSSDSAEGIAVFTLDHPKWYTMAGAAGFADLGLLLAQENGPQLVEQYAAEHYPQVKTIRLTIYVDVLEQRITKVLVDDSAFMTSIWEQVNQVLVERGEKPENLTRYELLSGKMSEYIFSQYNQVEPFEIP